MKDLPSVLDVAAYILAKHRETPLTTWKLQKLVYYSQVWSLVGKIPRCSKRKFLLGPMVLS